MFLESSGQGRHKWGKVRTILSTRWWSGPPEGNAIYQGERGTRSRYGEGTPHPTTPTPPEHGGPSEYAVQGRGLHGSKNSYPNPKRPVNMLHGTDLDPCFIWKWDPNPRRPEKYLKCTTRTRRGPDHYTKVGPEPGWEDTDPTHIAQQMLLSQ